MSKLDDLVRKQEEKLKESNIDIENSKFGKIYKKSKAKYSKYKSDEKQLTEEEKKEIRKYYFSQTITILIAIVLVIALIVRIIQIKF